MVKKTRELTNDAGVATLSDEAASIVAAIKLQYDDLKDEIVSLKKLLSEKDQHIDEMKVEITLLNKKVTKLENLVDEEDAYVRRESLILSGTIIPPSTPGEICSNVARKALKDKLNLEVQANEISVCHRLGPKSNTQAHDTRPLTVRFCRRETKRQVLFARTDNSHPNSTLYVNESLTPKRRTIMFALRKMKKLHPTIITGCNTLEGRCFVYTKMPASLPNSRSRDRKHVVNTHDALVDFCRDFVKKPLDAFLETWNH